MIRQKKKIKRSFILSILVVLILLSNLPMQNNFHSNSTNNDNNDFSQINKDNDELTPQLSDHKAMDSIVGDGVNQTVRIYSNNKSSSFNNKDGYFEIPAPVKMNLSTGEFYFEFNNNCTAEYVIEDDSALYPDVRHFEEYDFPTGDSYLNTNVGTEAPEGNYQDLINDINDWNISSSAGEVIFTICADYSAAQGSIDVDFDRENIMGFLPELIYDINEDVNVTVKMKDITGPGSYVNVTSTVWRNGSLSSLYFDDLIVNKNLKFINTTDCALIQFIFNRTDGADFNVTLEDFKLNPFMVLESPITDQKHLALEFDLRGKNSTINGFYAWIRTLNQTKAINAELNITLYRANTTFSRDQTNLLDNFNLVQPNLTHGLISSKIWKYNDYNGDELFYFDFDSSETDNLDRYNYFIVIKTNVTDEGIYSFVTIPRGDYGDGSGGIEHQLKSTNDNGDTWINTKSYINSRATDLQQLDASQFKLNVTRGFMPSDFEVDGSKTLKIQNKDIEGTNDLIDDLYGSGSNDGPDLSWGIGIWSNSFAPSIKCNGLNIFKVNLTWNNTYIKQSFFKFNVNYTVEGFSWENITTIYRANYDRITEWVFNFTLNLFEPRFNNWNFTRFMFTYPDYFVAHNLTQSNLTTALYPYHTGLESMLSDIPNYKYLEVSTDVIDLLDKAKYNGKYSLNLTSPNAIKDENIHSYINFYDQLWETRGFMYGDNISVSVDIQDHNGLAPSNKNSFVNATLFYPNGTKVIGSQNFLSNIGKKSEDGTLLTYDFNNATMLELTQVIPLAKELSKYDYYSLGFFWTNQSVVGCLRVPIYIDVYNIVLSNCVYVPEDNINNLQGYVENVNKYLKNYTLLIASINETTGEYVPDFYTVNNTFSEAEEIYSFAPFDVQMKQFLQNETILNPEEEVKFKILLENIDDVLDCDVKIHVKLVSLANEQWIINETTSETKMLERIGSGANTHEFEVSLKIPKFEADLSWEGVNAPIRQGGAKTIVTVYINDQKAGVYTCNNFSLIVNDTDSIFEGYTIGLKYSSGISAKVVHEAFTRSTCAYLPGKTTFMANLYDANYVSFFNQYVQEFTLKQNSNFYNDDYPTDLKKGETFSLTSDLLTEFGYAIPNEGVICKYYNVDNEWVNVTDILGITNVNGSVTFEIDTLKLDIENSLMIKLIWSGDNYIGNCSKSIPLPMVVQADQLSLNCPEANSYLYRNSEEEIITLNIKNSGNSILRIIDINLDIEDDLDYEIIGEDELLLYRLDPGKTFFIDVKIDTMDTDYNTIDITVSIYALNIISNEFILEQKVFSVDITDRPINDHIINYFYLIIALIFLLLFAFAFIYRKKVKKRVAIAPKTTTEKRPRRGRYVKVSELKKAEIKEEEKTIEEPKDEKEDIFEEEPELEPEPKAATTDFDSLIEEETISEEVIIEDTEKSIKKKKLPKKVIAPKKEKKPKEKKPKKEKAPKKEKPEEIFEEEPELEPVPKAAKTDFDSLIEEEIPKAPKKEKKLPKKVSKPKKEKQLPKKVSKPKKAGQLSTSELVKLKKGKKRKKPSKKAKKAPKKGPKKKTTDLDDLLKEKGI